MSALIKKSSYLVAVLLVVAAGFAGAQASLKPGLSSYRPPITGHDVMVESNQPLATMAGYKVLAAGGNAFDAAVAVAAALSVVEPYLSNIFGGDAFINCYSAKEKKVFVVNASGPAPTGATPEFYLAKGGIPSVGILSVEVPGAFSGWMQLLQRYGTMTPAQVFQPAVDLCENGRTVTPYFFNQISANTIKNFNDEAKKIFTVDGQAPPLGSIIVQRDLAQTFRQVGSAGGPQAAEDMFYRGDLAKRIVAFSKKMGGLLTEQDFANYRAEFVEPLHTNYQGIDVYACPPGCQGFVLIEALNILENFDVKSLGLNSAKYINLIVEALNLAMDDRNRYDGDPRFVTIPIKALTSKAYAKERAKWIEPGKAKFKGMPVTATKPYEGENTTFFSVVDKDRNVVACTTSILNGWGSALIAGDTGIFLNDRMAYFWLDKNHPNVVAPGKRTFQTITPGIALKDGKPWMAWGTPGADVQEQTKLLNLFNIMYFDMNPQQAIEAPKFRSDSYPSASFPHTAYPGRINLEGRIPTTVDSELKAMGYDVTRAGDWSTNFGGAGMILIDPETNFLMGGVDPRREGYVVGW